MIPPDVWSLAQRPYKMVNHIEAIVLMAAPTIHIHMV
jgi:hypothetical protein